MIRSPRLLLLLAASVAAYPAAAPANGGARVAPLLPEVTKHLDQARDAVRSGKGGLAGAHAEMVLIGDEVRFAVRFENVPESLRANSRKALEEALGAWERSLGESVRFVEVADPANAHVQVRFKRDVYMGKEPVAGFANWKRIIRTDGPDVVESRFTADLQIRTMNLDGKAMPAAAMRHEVMHEFGHVLGLEDCDHTGILMGPLDVRKPVSAPLPHETAAVRDLRDEARRVRFQALNLPTGR